MTEEEDKSRKAAIRRLQAKRSFGQDLVAYIVVNAFLVIVWLMTGAGYFWPGWVLAGWGLGLVLHGYTVFVQKPITEADIRREMGRGA
jgi:hypothetical protein